MKLNIIKLEDKIGEHSTDSYENITCKDCDFHESTHEGQKSVDKIAKKHLKNNPTHTIIQQAIGIGYEPWIN